MHPDRKKKWRIKREEVAKEAKEVRAETIEDEYKYQYLICASSGFA